MFFVDDMIADMFFNPKIVIWEDKIYPCEKKSENKKLGEFETKQSTNRRIKIKDVIFSDPATVVFWSDGTKTVVKTRGGEEYDKEKGLAMAIIKRLSGNTRDYYNLFMEWCKYE